MVDFAERGRKKRVADRISALPDEIVELILSKLSLRDAMRTGFLCRRWKHMWEYTTGTLDFDFKYKEEYISNGMRKWRLRYKRSRVDYISLVNNILNAHKGSTAETFNVCYSLDIRNKLDIDSWIDFALRKKVRKLNLNFTQPYHDLYRSDFRGSYEFPLPLLEKSKVSCLTSLSLYCVDVTVEVLNYLLSNSPFLESLRVELSSDDGVHLAPCPKLKHLDIEVRSGVLEISSAPNLTSFIFSGSMHASLSIKNVPNLSCVSLGGFFCKDIIYKSRELPSFLFQLKNLTLELQTDTMNFPKFPKFPELNNINELKLTFTGANEHQNSDIFSCVSLMEACPNLYKFSMKQLTLANLREAPKREKWSINNKSLKVVKLKEFGGTNMELEFYKFLLSSAPSLHKIIVDISEIYDDEKKPKVDKYVRRLTRQLSPSAELEIRDRFR